MTYDYSEDADVVGDAMDAVYENKQVNKKNNVDGDFSTDSESYPTVRAMKNEDEKKVDKIQATANQFVITNNVRNVDLKNKIGNIDINGAIGSTSGLLVVTDNSGVLNTSNTLITIAEKSSPNTGALKTYQLRLNGSAVTGSTDIDIPNMADMFLRSASIEIVSNTPSHEETDAGLVPGDKYLKLVINTSSSETGATILRVKLTDFIDTYSADETTLTLSQSNVFSIKIGGVGTNHLADGAVTTVKIGSKQVTLPKIADEVANKWVADTRAEISDFALQLAERINPSSP